VDTISDVAIMRRLIKPGEDDLSPEAAQAILRFDFDPKDRERMHELAVKGQQSTLTTTEEAQLASYRRVGRLVDFMRSKARLALKKNSAAG
jgi:hypothetical protein